LLEITLNGINLYFTVAIIFLFLFEILLILFSKREISIKSVILSVGIFGTFWGIFSGLQQFDVNDIDNSLSDLLNGMTTAFYSSLLGMGATILSGFLEKIKELFSKKDTAIQKVETISEQSDREISENILKELIQQNKFIQDNSKKLEKLNILEKLELNSQKIDQNLQNLQENQNSQNQILINEFQKNFNEMNINLKEALEKLSDGASKEIIQALESVISDFNTNLTEQFGSNFEKLNLAVFKLVEWQENYKNSVIETEKGLQSAIISISKSDESLENITQRNSEVLEVYEKIRLIIETYQKQTEELNRHLMTYSDLSDRAKEIFPNLEQQFIEINGEIKNIGKNAQENSDITTNHILQNSDEVRKDFTKLQNNLSANLEEVSKTFIDNSEASKIYIEENNREIKANFNDLNQSVTDNFDSLKNNISSSNSEIAESFKTATSSIKSELENSQKIITSISEKFDNLTSKSSEAVDNIKNQLDKLIENLEKNISDSMHKLRNESKNLGASIEETKNQSIEALKQQKEAIDKNRQEFLQEFNESLGNLNTALTKLTNKFRDDYELNLSKINKLFKDLHNENH
jgi:biopolymer transport protein ExbB/TolQ